MPTDELTDELEGRILVARSVLAGKDYRYPVSALILLLAETVVHLGDNRPTPRFGPQLASSTGKGGLEP